MGHVCRLALVSQILYDKELIEMRQENERLKLSLFWTKYNAFKLNAAIRVRNQMESDDPFNCDCRVCIIARRYCVSDDMSSDDEHVPNVKCEFEPLFEAKLAEFGLIFAVVPDHLPVRLQYHECAVGLRRGREAINAPAHIVAFGCDPKDGRRPDMEDWGHFTYGAKLFKATTVNDPELKKLEDLFTWLLSVGSGAIRESLMDGLGLE
jgi:hypothetical protein